jgi:hypothetical protein
MESNIHLIRTDKFSKLQLERDGGLHLEDGQSIALKSFLNIYIASDEEIKEGDYWIYICPINGLDYGDNNNPIVKNNLPPTWFEKLHDKENYKKIILTTDPNLIQDGVQSISDEFIQWIVKNPNCERVEVQYWFDSYKILIPKEDPKKEPKKKKKKEKNKDAAEYEYLASHYVMSNRRMGF